MSAAPDFGPNPWQQAHWDWRAAGNFMFGGAGSGLLVFTVIAGARGLAATLLVLAGLALIGLGLLCVWLEIGRPLRAMNVMRRPGSSWMSRESLAAPLVFALGLGVAAGLQAWAPLLLLAALWFVYCQARLLQAARGIPAWREPLTVPLLVATGIAEGAGLFWLAGADTARGTPLLAFLFSLAVLARLLVWRLWRERVGAAAVRPALAAIDGAGAGVRWIGGIVAMLLALLGATGFPGGALVLALAGLCAAAAGAWFKFTLITRAGYNQGFRLERLPVRGQPR